jgi:MFS family permease
MSFPGSALPCSELSADDIAGQVIAGKSFDDADRILRGVIRDQACETAHNRDPVPEQHKALILRDEFVRGGVPIDADHLLGVMAASVLSFVSIPLSGHISDLIGRRRMYMLGAITVGVFGFVYFGLMNTGSTTLIFLAIVLSLVPHDMMYGPQAAFIAESFTGRLRYSGASMGYQLASIIAGGPAPLIATALFAEFKSGYAIAVYILVCAIITLIAAAMMKDYTGKDIEGEYE